MNEKVPKNKNRVFETYLDIIFDIALIAFMSKSFF